MNGWLCELYLVMLVFCLIICGLFKLRCVLWVISM